MLSQQDASEQSDITSHTQRSGFMDSSHFSERRARTRLVDGRAQQIILKGWYIDPDTGQRVEADF